MRTWWRGNQTSLWRAWHLKLSLRNGTRGVEFQAKAVRKASKQKNGKLRRENNYRYSWTLRLIAYDRYSINSW